MEPRCEYAYSLVDGEPLAPSGPADEGADADTVWHCPHAALEGRDLCAFYAPVEATDPDSVATAVEELLAGDGEGPPELIGARFGTLDLSGTVIDHGATPVDLRAVTVEGEVRLAYTDVRSPLIADGGTVYKDVCGERDGDVTLPWGIKPAVQPVTHRD